MSNKTILEFEIEDRQLLSLMPRCATCEHWVHDGPHTGKCAKQSAIVTTLSVGLSDPTDFPASVVRPLRTAPDFGCVLHEPKEGE